jgi:hypothetical protein
MRNCVIKWALKRYLLAGDRLIATDRACMAISFPFMTSYDPPGTSEGSLDPLGLYQIADQLGVQLVPAVRERMQRIRFLTAMAVGAMVTEDIDDDPRHRDASPYLVWEWLIVEALMREMSHDKSIWGVPGAVVTRRAISRYGSLDARSYLKIPRIFGFNGVYKPLAVRLGLVDVHLGQGPNAERLLDAWAHGLSYAGIAAAKPLLSRWQSAIRRSLADNPPHTRPGWGADDWAALANAFAPTRMKTREKRQLRELLLEASDDHGLGALPWLWELQAEFDDEGFREEPLHNRLEKLAPQYRLLLQGIRAYEAFARSLQAAFDTLKAEAAGFDALGFFVPDIAKDKDFALSVRGLHKKFEAAHRALSEVPPGSFSFQNLFDERFGSFAEPMDNATCALALCLHHERIQASKSVAGKRPWFDRIGQDRIYVRHQYRDPKRDILPDRYVHTYRGWPIRRFYSDLL